MFKPGDPRINYDGYTKEMRMKNKALEDIAREHAEEAVATLVDLLRTGSDGVKRAAAEALLDRAYGKPVDRQAVLQLGAGAGEAVEQLTEAQLLRIANGAFESTNPGSGFRGQVIDLRPVSRDDDE
jgi:HEAT repeat protein